MTFEAGGAEPGLNEEGAEPVAVQPEVRKGELPVDRDM